MLVALRQIATGTIFFGHDPEVQRAYDNGTLQEEFEFVMTVTVR